MIIVYGLSATIALMECLQVKLVGMQHIPKLTSPEAVFCFVFFICKAQHRQRTEGVIVPHRLWNEPVDPC